MKKLGFIFLITLMLACNSNSPKEEKETMTTEAAPIPILNIDQANKLASLPIHCINTEYPNKLGQVLGGEEDLKSPKELHPAFYGCFDWHSAVHGHWSLVSLLKQFPNLEGADSIKQNLLANISKEHIDNSPWRFRQPYARSW